MDDGMPFGTQVGAARSDQINHVAFSKIFKHRDMKKKKGKETGVA